MLLLLLQQRRPLLPPVHLVPISDDDNLSKLRYGATRMYLGGGALDFNQQCRAINDDSNRGNNDFHRGRRWKDHNDLTHLRIIISVFFLEEWMMVIGGERDYSSVFLESVTLSALDGGTVPDCLKNLADFPSTIARGAAAVIGMPAKSTSIVLNPETQLTQQ